jgi:pilus assembly protein CpaB
MNRRSVLLLLATLVAVIGTALVFVYVRNADNRALKQYDTVDVLTAVETIEAGETIEAAQGAGKLKLTPVPQNQVLDGALDNTKTLTGMVAVTNIYPGEQIVPSKFGGQPEGEVLAIPKGLQAISVQLSDPGRVAGFVEPGSEVAIYHEQLEQGSVGGVKVDGRVVLLLKRVLVLGVGSTSTTTKTTTTTEDTQTTQEIPKTLLTIAVNQKDAERVLFATSEPTDHGEIAFGLLTDDSTTDYTRGTWWDTLYSF